MGIFFLIPLFAQTRSFDDIFPHLAPEIRSRVFSPQGFIESLDSEKSSRLLNASSLDPRLSDGVFDGEPTFLLESLLVLPMEDKPSNLLAVYNALGKIRALKGRLYFSESRRQNIPLFEEATRIAGEKRTTAIPDPGPATVIPPSETIYLRIKDANFGNSYYRGNIRQDFSGLIYHLSNYKDLTYLFVPVIQEEKFAAQIYFEPIAEGILLYSLAGAEVSKFISSKIDMPSAIAKRLAVIISWVVDGIGPLP